MPAPDSIITLDDAKLHLRISDDVTDHDQILQQLIDGASQAIASYCGRLFMITTETAKKLDGDGTDTLLLKYPVQSISSLSNDGTAVVVTTNYELYETIGRVVLTDGTVWVNGRKTVTITYTYGYSIDDIPRDVVSACLYLVASKFQAFQQDRIGVTSKTFGDQSISYERGIPKEVRELLIPWQIVNDDRWAY